MPSLCSPNVPATQQNNGGNGDRKAGDTYGNGINGSNASCLQGERYRTGSYARSEPGGYQARNQHSEDVRGASVMSGV
jgi:hypothetical protein